MVSFFLRKKQEEQILKVLTVVKKAISYLLGLLIITIGINISKMSALGISPVSSIPRACEVKWGLTLGVTTMIIYCILVALQVIILRKKFRIINALGILLTVVFGWMIDFTGTDPNAFGHLMLHFPRPEGYLMQLLYSVVSVIIIGLGVFLYLRPKWIPMPAEGLAGAIAEVSGKPFGDCKTLVDCSMIFVALMIQLIFLGGFSSFTSDTVVVREGTIIAAVCVGQVVKLLTKWIGKPLDAFLNK